MLHALSDFLLAIPKSRVETVCQVMPELVYTLGGLQTSVIFYPRRGKLTSHGHFQQH